MRDLIEKGNLYSEDSLVEYLIYVNSLLFPYFMIQLK